MDELTSIFAYDADIHAEDVLGQVPQPLLDAADK